MKIYLTNKIVNVSLLVASLLFTNVGYAETWVNLGGGSVHFCHSCGYNNFNPGLGIQTNEYLKVTDFKLLAGGYYNSYNKVTMYGGASYQPIQYGIVKVGLMGAVVTNYNELRVPILALPVISIEGDQVGMDILGSPSIQDYSGLITVNLKVKL